MGLSVCLFLTGALEIPAVGQMLQQQNLFYSSASWIQHIHDKSLYESRYANGAEGARGVWGLKIHVT